MYFSLFMSAFAAATILPAQSEALLGYLVSQNPSKLVSLVFVATVGNVLGSVANWWLGKQAHRLKGKFSISEKTLQRGERFYKRYGRYSLLLSWVPIIGDPITVVAGIMRENILIFLLLVSSAKLLRYLVVVGAVSFLV